MSDPNSDMLGTMRASIRSHLGEFADQWIACRIEILRKLQLQIGNCQNVDDIPKLQAMVNDALISESDVTMMKAKVDGLLDIWKKYAETKRTILDLLSKPSHRETRL
jgi:hypothetical protein